MQGLSLLGVKENSYSVGIFAYSNLDAINTVYNAIVKKSSQQATL